MKNEKWRIQVELSGFFSILASIVLLSISCLTSNLVRCVLRVAASLLRTYCFRLTWTHIVWFLRRTKENCASNHYNTPKSLRVSFLFFLRVSPKATAIAFKSLHLLLSLNTEYGGQGRIVLVIINNFPIIPSEPSYLQATKVTPNIASATGRLGVSD